MGRASSPRLNQRKGTLMNTLEKIAAKYVEFQKYYHDYEEQGDLEMSQIISNRAREIISVVNIINEHKEFWKEVEKILKNA